ncbi:MAG: hypothetical protein E2O38_13690, partial [Proteobacteria bacterium]
MERSNAQLGGGVRMRLYMDISCPPGLSSDPQRARRRLFLLLRFSPLIALLVAACTDGSAGDTKDLSDPAPTVQLTVTPQQVAYNGETILDWSSTNASSCVAAGDWAGTKNTSGSDTRGSLTATSTFILTCSGAGRNAGQSVTVMVQPPANQAPVANTDSATTAQDVALIIDVLANDTDADAGDTLTVSTVTQPANGSVVNNNTDVTYTPNTGFSGPDTFTYIATDGTNVSNSATVTVMVTAVPPPPPPANQAPVITSAPLTAATENVAYLYDVDASDPDAGDMLSFSLTTAPAGMTISAATGVIDWIPTDAQTGDQNVTVEVTDNALPTAGSDTQSFTVTVGGMNQAPVANADSVTTAQDVALIIDVLANDTDADAGDTLTVSTVT